MTRPTIDLPPGMNAAVATAALDGLARAMAAAEVSVPITQACCPECGPGMGWDEDGCCLACGTDLFYDENSKRRPENFAVLMSMPDHDAVTDAIARFAADVKVKVTANTEEAGYVSLAHLYGLLDPVIAQGTKP